jgi:hypothetical protein
MLFLSEKDVRQCLTMKDSLEATRVALISLATGEARVPTRVGLSCTAPSSPSDKATDTADWSLFKPAALDNADVNKSTKLMGMKLASIRAKNPAAGLPTVPATVLTLDVETGYVDAIVASTYLTAVRTAAGSALATALARPDLTHLVVFWRRDTSRVPYSRDCDSHWWSDSPHNHYQSKQGSSRTIKGPNSFRMDHGMQDRLAPQRRSPRDYRNTLDGRLYRHGYQREYSHI